MVQSTERATLRRRAGLSQAQLAWRTGISAPRLCLWEHNLVELRPEQLERIQRVLCGELVRWLRSLNSDLAASAA